MLFYVTPGVGADQGIVKDGRLCKLVDIGKITEDPMSPPPSSDNLNTRQYKKEFIWPYLYVGEGQPAVSNWGWRLGQLGSSTNSTVPKAPAGATVKGP
jgi:hypothetical protein